MACTAFNIVGNSVPSRWTGISHTGAENRFEQKSCISESFKVTHFTRIGRPTTRYMCRR